MGIERRGELEDVSGTAVLVVEIGDFMRVLAAVE